MMMRILLADDQIDVREGLKVILEQEPDIDIIGEAEGIESLISQTKMNCPDVVLLDWELSNIRMTEIIPLLRLFCPDIKILAMSVRPEAYKSALAAGVDGFVSKGEQPEVLLETIKDLRID
jgi:DNA-binding NarL/FixJ family response regulator